jgi:short-subunit dehydrogenase
MIDISKEWAVVTGGSSGIGLCFAETLAKRGANLVLISIQQKELEEQRQRLSADYGIEVLTLYLNLAQTDATVQVTKFLAEHNITPLIFINNAGIFSFAPVTEIPEGKIETFIDLHIRAVTNLSRAMAIEMSQRAKGYILNMSSMSCIFACVGLRDARQRCESVDVLSGRHCHQLVWPAGQLDEARSAVGLRH